MKNQILKLCAFLLLATAATSCTPDAILQDTQTDTPQDAAFLEGVFQDVDEVASYKMDPDAAGSLDLGDCPVITYAQPPGTFPNTVTFDFGEGCVDPRTGRTKSGKVMVYQSDAWGEVGAIRTFTPEDFTVDGNLVEGSRTVTFVGENSDGNPYWTILVENASLTDENGNVFSWEAERVRTQIEGVGNESLEDDVFSIEGGASGTNRRGLAFTSSITQPLIFKRDCNWIVAGIRTMEVNGRSRTLDFGDGTCDDLAEITCQGGHSKTIHLKGGLGLLR